MNTTDREIARGLAREGLGLNGAGDLVNLSTGHAVKGTPSNAGWCMDCHKGTVHAGDGTVVIHHLSDCPQHPANRVRTIEVTLTVETDEDLTGAAMGVIIQNALQNDDAFTARYDGRLIGWVAEVKHEAGADRGVFRVRS